MLHVYRDENSYSQAGVKRQEDVSSDQTVVSSALVNLNQKKNPCVGAGDKCVLAILPVYVKAKKGKKIIETYAFIYTGSSATFCTDSLARQLHLQRKGTELILTTMGSSKEVKSCILRDLEVCGLEEASFINLPKVFNQKILQVKKGTHSHAGGHTKMAVSP